MQLTPMMQQYVEIKEQYKDCILFYRLGDFYEMFFEDAIITSKELEITLTGKNYGQEEKAPMCGVPYHAVEGYLNRMILKGYKVAICEQVEDSKSTKGIVKREVIRIVTPGTNMNHNSLDESKNNYLMCILYAGSQYGISVVDISTGDYLTTRMQSEKKLLDEINKYAPSEIICNEALFMSPIDLVEVKNRYNLIISALEPWYFDDELCIRKLKEHFKVTSLEGLGLQDYDLGVIASGGLLQYLYETQKNALIHLTTITGYQTNKYMILDTSTRRNLELTETLREKQKRGSMLWVLDKTKTAMGARLLRSYIEQPLIDKNLINERLDAISSLNDNVIVREELREYLNPIYDLERLVSKISYKTATPRDFISLKSSMDMFPHIKSLLYNLEGDLFIRLHETFDILEDLSKLIEDAVSEEPPLAIKEGGIIKTGYNSEVDKLRLSKTEGKRWLSDLEAKEKEQTGIKNLKIRYNKIFGYYLEVTNSYQNMVPESWIRKQTLANAERYITPELKELEDIILGAEDKLFSLEYDLFTEIRESIAKEVKRIQTSAKIIAQIDLFTSLALVADRGNYIRPTINEEGIIDIKEGRHPVVEKMIGDNMFVSNDAYLDNDNNRISIITGPNMAGKSTYMRQTALLVLMAQIGSFIPASSANISIVDRIFTRVGASDDLASGQSTFMVEMTEVANILRNATNKSLLILDEIGRGTSTFDGLSIAFAVVEHIASIKLLGAKTLFATHYHELTELEGKLKSVHNYCIAVKERGDDIVFLRKIIKGGADKSYGIQVAKLAGVPDSVINRAKEIVEELSDSDITTRAKELVPLDVVSIKKKNKDCFMEKNQLSLFTENNNKENELILEISNLDLSVLTPIEALNKLYQLQTKIKERGM